MSVARRLLSSSIVQRPADAAVHRERCVRVVGEGSPSQLPLHARREVANRGQSSTQSNQLPPSLAKISSFMFRKYVDDVVTSRLTSTVPVSLWRWSRNNRCARALAPGPWKLSTRRFLLFRVRSLSNFFCSCFARAIAEFLRCRPAEPHFQ